VFEVERVKSKTSNKTKRNEDGLFSIMPWSFSRPNGFRGARSEYREGWLIPDLRGLIRHSIQVDPSRTTKLTPPFFFLPSNKKGRFISF